MIEDVKVSGRLSKVTASGKYGVILLPEPRAGLKFAVINDETLGRIDVMRRLGGPLRTGAEVTIRRMEQRSEAFVALQIE